MVRVGYGLADIGPVETVDAEPRGISLVMGVRSKGVDCWEEYEVEIVLAVEGVSSPLSRALVAGES